VRSCLCFLLFCCLSSQIRSAGAAQLTVNWKDNATNEAGFKIERKNGTLGTYALFTTTAANVTTVLDTSLTAGVLVCYRVYAFNSSGNSGYSNEACSLPDISTPTVIAYNFNEGSGTTVKDLSGNGRNGTVSGATWTTGKFSNALAFNGSTAKVTSGLS